MPKRCQEEGCTKQPSFNFKGHITRLYCSKHKKDGMISLIRNRKCDYIDCKKRPLFNFKGQKQGLYCSKHKQEGMIDIKSKKCIEINCTTQSNYNYESERKGVYCSIHKKEGMIDIKSKKCIEYNCNSHSSFNMPGEKYGIYCLIHKKENMINVKDKLCIHNKQIKICKECGGSQICIHNRYKSICKECGGSAICEHNRNKNICKECSGSAICEHKIYKAHCRECGGSKLCKSSWCSTISNKSKYEGYCLNCFIHLFPDKPNTRNYKTKEKATTDYILKIYPDFSWVTDKKIQDGCSCRRPDLLLDLGYQVIIVEVDENQHQDYDCSCENKRLMLLSQDVGHRPIVFIRFNPDEYNTKDGKVTSCWSLNSRGICTVKKTKAREWNKRLESLKIQIEYWLYNKTEKTVEIIQLFYDCD